MELREAEKTIGKFGDLLPAAEKLIEAYKLLVLREAYDLVRKAKESNKPFLVLPKQQCDKIQVALHPHVYADQALTEKGYYHFLIKRMPVFEEGDKLPTSEEWGMERMRTK